MTKKRAFDLKRYYILGKISLLQLMAALAVLGIVVTCLYQWY